MECVFFLFALSMVWVFFQGTSPSPQAPHREHRPKAPVRQSPPTTTPKAPPPSEPQTKACEYRGCRVRVGLKKQYCRPHAREYQSFVERHCGRKVPHANRSTADAHARELETKSRARYAVYQCEVCGSFHVGHAK